MRARTVLLLFLAIVLAGSTAMLARSWLNAQRNKEIAEAAPLTPPKPVKSVLVARADLRRGQILRPEDLVWQVWPEGGIDKNYVVMGGPRTPESFAGWVAKNPVGAGEPVTDAKVIAPGDRGFLAAVLRPGMRAISVPVTVTSGISGFIFPGDQVDLLLTYQVPAPPTTGERPEKDRLRAQGGRHRAAQHPGDRHRPAAREQGRRGGGRPYRDLRGHPEAERGHRAGERNWQSCADPTQPGARSRESAAAGDKVADAPGDGPSPDSPIVESATYTLDNEISPLLPKRASGKG